MSTSLRQSLLKAMSPVTMLGQYRPMSSHGGSYLLNLLEAKRPELSDAVQVFEKAEALRAHGQQQVVRAATALADPSNWDLDRLRRPDGSLQRPRVELRAELNSRQTLTVLWLPVVDPSCEETRQWGSPIGDFANRPNTFNQHGVHPQTLIRLVESDYCHDCRQDPQFDAWSDPQDWADRLLRSALEDTLCSVLAGVSAVCDVRVSAWPEFVNGRELVLTSPQERALADVDQQLKQVDKAYAPLLHAAQTKLTSTGLASFEEYLSLRESAEAAGTRFTRLLWETTGRKSTALLTAALDALLPRLREMGERQAELKAIQQALQKA